MRRILTSATILSFGFLGACNVNVDNKTEAAVESSADSLGNTVETIADDAGNTLEAGADAAGNALDKAGGELEKAGDKIGDKADDLADGVDVDVKVGDHDDKAANSH
ncbi:hypothetical protein [Sphingosinicella sp. BN140058]|uniref:hypothetical protein n=1 Tax=Sphingosinicella sp. BN140058 TaxID=1892855 RepID=UPI001011211D|nr:hypothetical protein [Sphingosinicella sp. BN140058]QAY76036.1 hypothetical protein ETR14_05465 [Sphingosinicella sp. BN140058]